MWHLIAAIQYIVLALVFVAISVFVGKVSWLSLGCVALFASKAAFEVHMYRIYRTTKPDYALAAGALRRLGQGYCVVAGLWLVSAATREHIIGWFVGPAWLMVGGTYWLMTRGAESNSTWSPFQSPEVREICAHLTADERARLEENAGRYGREIAGWVVLPVAVVSISFLWSARLGFVGVAVFALYFVAALWPKMRAMRLRSVELMCQSEWARGRGYTAATLRSFAFPWSR